MCKTNSMHKNLFQIWNKNRQNNLWKEGDIFCRFFHKFLLHQGSWTFYPQCKLFITLMLSTRYYSFAYEPVLELARKQSAARRDVGQVFVTRLKPLAFIRTASVIASGQPARFKFSWSCEVFCEYLFRMCANPLFQDYRILTHNKKENYLVDY